MTTYMLDTNICSLLMRDASPTAEKRLTQRAPRHVVSISSVVYFELRKGALTPGVSRGWVPAIAALVGRLNKVEPWNAEAADAAARIYTALAAEGALIGGYDTLIAGHALALGATLVTNNTREFERVKGLKLEDWS